MNAVPNWWGSVESDIHATVAGFVDWTRGRIENKDPQQLIRKNPFLYRARSFDNSADKLANRLIEAYLSSSEETKFGDILEEIAILVCQAAKEGRKSSTQGIDLEYDENNVRTLIQIKSGMNWGNSSQRKRLLTDFSSARKVVWQNTNFIRGEQALEVRCVEGICYGPSQTKNLDTHFKIVGNDFWKEISGWRGSAQAVLNVIGIHAGNGLSEARDNARVKLVSYLRIQGIANPNGEICWDRLLDFVMEEPNHPDH